MTPAERSKQGELDFSGHSLTGRKHPDTSYKAGATVDRHFSKMMRIVYDSIWGHGFKGATMGEVADALGKGKNCISPRVSQLRDKGFIYDTGERRSSPNCGKSIVWRVKE